MNGNNWRMGVSKTTADGVEAVGTWRLRSVWPTAVNLGIFFFSVTCTPGPSRRLWTLTCCI
jgi:hypothetical protein